jgi:hypothetical protein
MEKTIGKRLAMFRDVAWAEAGLSSAMSDSLSRLSLAS